MEYYLKGEIFVKASFLEGCHYRIPINRAANIVCRGIGIEGRKVTVVNCIVVVDMRALDSAAYLADSVCMILVAKVCVSEIPYAAYVVAIELVNELDLILD